MNIKTIILLIGVLLFIIGFINQYKIIENKKYVYKILPRSVYDEVYFSLPMLDYGVDYDEELYNNMNPSYVLDDENNYNSLFEKPVKKCEDTTSKGCEINYYYPNDIYAQNKKIFIDEITSNYQFN
jgi:hypothetical protein